MVRASIKNKVKKFMFISTDKVINPSSIMGKTKLEAEKIILNANKNKKNKYKTMFSLIRFGNIIGSRGSVLPKFIEQISSNQNLTVTNKKMTRFFTTISLAVSQIFQSLKIMKGREIFIIHNMSSFKIIDLAKALKRYFKYKKKISIEGIREGEKLFEELATPSEISKSKIINNLLIVSKNNKLKKNNNSLNLDLLNSKKGKLLEEKSILEFLKKSRLI